MITTRMNPRIKKWMLAIAAVLLSAAVFIWYIFIEKFADTKDQKADYTVNAMDIIKEFRNDEKSTNAKYVEKIVIVRGRVTAVEPADTTVNIKMSDPETGDYIIFDFQKQHGAKAKTVAEGDSVAIKASCSGGIYSNILETESITFKRAAINQLFK